MPDGHSISDAQQKIVNDNLVDAVGANDREKIDLCLRKGADINARWGSWYDRTPLMIAVAYSNADLVAFVLTKKPDLFLKDKNGKTAFDLTADVSDGVTRKGINRLLLAALPDPETPAASAPAADNAVPDQEIPVLKPIAFDRRKKSGGSFQL